MGISLWIYPGGFFYTLFHDTICCVIIVIKYARLSVSSGYRGIFVRKRIYRISEDKFDKQQPHIEFENEKIELSCYVGSIATGSIDFHSTNDVSARGVVYCSTPYVTLSTTQFDGTDVSIEFTVKDLYFKDKESVSGYFTIVTVGLEKDIPFTVT